MVSEMVLGGDDRVEVVNVQGTPFRWVCQLLISAANGSSWLGTGWLAAPGLVITAGHCVYMHNQGGWVRQVDVLPARNGPTEPYLFVSTEPYSVDGWVTHKLPDYDYGALIIQPDVALGTLGYFGYGALGDADLMGSLANVVGYPSDKDPGTMWGSVRTVRDVRPTTLIYDIDTYGGQSGAPVIRWDGTDYIVVGIHNYGDLAGNQATRITSSVFQNIGGWRSLLP
jgi:V8-like Glu-specific endopeptidase